MASVRKPKATPAPLGRYLRRFTLENVRTFRSKVELDFCHADGKVAQWTVILGENGTGKTTLLQYLAGMMPTDVYNHGPEAKMPFIAPTLAGDDWRDWNAANCPVSCSGEMTLRGTLETTPSSPTLRGAGTSSAKSLPLELEIVFWKSVGRVNVQGQGTWNGLALKVASMLRLFGYGASRHVAGAASPYLSSDSFSKNEASEPANTLFNDDAPLISPEQWFLGLDHSSRGSGEMATTAKRAFKSATRCFAAALRGLQSIEVKPHVGASGQTQMTLMCRTEFGEVPFSSLSLGYRTMAAWLTDFIKRMHEAFPDLDEPDDGPAIVLIDEFDLHLHPKWQREAMAALSKEFPNTQFIVTAHSPLVVQATEGEAKIIVLRRKQRADGTEEVEVINDPRYAAGWRVDQILTSALYGFDSPRSVKYEAKMERRVHLRQKPKLTATEKKELGSLEAEIAKEAPAESSPASEQLFAELQRALARAEKPKTGR